MDAHTAAREAAPHVERIATYRFRPDVPELAGLIERHRYFGVYAVGRTAPLRAGPEVVYAAMGLFPRGLVEKFLGRIADDGGLDALRDAYLDACDAIGDRLFGALPDGDELAERLDAVAAAADLAGRVLAAAWAALPPPAGVGARVERAATVIREHRGNAHLAILQTHGLTGPDGLVLTALWRGDEDPEAHARSFGWRDDDLVAAC